MQMDQRQQDHMFAIQKPLLCEKISVHPLHPVLIKTLPLSLYKIVHSGKNLHELSVNTQLIYLRRKQKRYPRHEIQMEMNTSVSQHKFRTGQCVCRNTRA